MNQTRHFLWPVRGCSGSALVEFVSIVFILTVLIFAVIDFGRVITTRQTLINLSREGANLALRQTALSNAVTAVVASANPLNINANGRIILSSVTNFGSGFRCADQAVRGGLSSSFAPSKIAPGGRNTTATMPTRTPLIPQPKQTAYVAEIYYKIQPITPIGKLLKVAFPTNMYDVAYF
jgi:Flp pilus assembly protein TadG